MPQAVGRHLQQMDLRPVVHFPDLLVQRAPDLPRWPLGKQALVHLHCHHKSVLGTDSVTALLSRMGVDASIPDPGCCGMAGSFGLHVDKVEVSLRCAERALLPAVRSLDDDALLIADGNSCREQIEQCSGRVAAHLSEVLIDAIPDPAMRSSRPT